MSSLDSLIFVTGNKNKLAEVKAILGSAGVEIKSQAIDLVEIQGSTQEISTDKARRAALAVNGPVLVEDTCLCFNALNGLPGPYIKHFLTSLGTPNDLPTLLAGFPDKSAYALCTFAYCSGPDGEVVLFEGRTEGSVVEARGSRDFGWDCVFEPREGGGETYAEMSKERKNGISHRYRALEKVKEFLAAAAEGSAKEE
ncbi:nucleoside triphosphate pyrophosphohydrolase ham1 [Saitoella coloradoensis]